MAQNQNVTKFVLWAPDCTDEGARARHLAAQSSHFKNIYRLVEEGIMRVGGGVQTEDSASAAPADRQHVGSCMIIEAESLEAARKIVESDPYYKHDVWDKEKMEVLPIALGHPLPPLNLNEVHLA